MEEAKTLIAADVEITGAMKCAGGVKMAGKLNGDLVCGGDVLVEKGAAVKGNIAAASIVVLGLVKGNIVAKDRLELKGAARVAGDIRARRLVVEEGVSLVGKSEVSASESAAAEADRPGEAPAFKFEEAGKSDDAGAQVAPVTAGPGMRPPVDNRPRAAQLFARK